MLKITESRRYFYIYNVTLFIRTEVYTLGVTGGIALASATSNNQDAAMYVCRYSIICTVIEVHK